MDNEDLILDDLALSSRQISIQNSKHSEITGSKTFQTYFYPNAVDTIKAYCQDSYLKFSTHKIHILKDQYEEICLLLEDLCSKNLIFDEQGYLIDTIDKTLTHIKKLPFTYKQIALLAKEQRIVSLAFSNTENLIIYAGNSDLNLVINYAYAIWSGFKVEEALSPNVLQQLQLYFESNILTANNSDFRSEAVETKNRISKILKKIKGKLKLNQGSKQLGSNLTIAASSAGGSFIGTVAGASLGTIIPVLGNGVGALIGSIIGSLGAEAGSRATLKMLAEKFNPDKQQSFIELTKKALAIITHDYLLTYMEVRALVNECSKILTREYFDGLDKISPLDAVKLNYAYNELVPLAEKIIADRVQICFEPK